MKRRYVESGYLPGMLTHIYRKGYLVHTGLCGQMDIERGKPMREDAIFRIYSMSKPITAVALMMLVEEGLIGLDDPVHSYIPAWKDIGVYASGMPSLLPGASPRYLTTPTLRPMKVVDLATHTSGLTYGFMNRTGVDAAYRRAKAVDRETPGGLNGLIEQLAQIPLDFYREQPGIIRFRSTCWAILLKSCPACGSASSCARGCSNRLACTIPRFMCRRTRSSGSPAAISPRMVG